MSKSPKATEAQAKFLAYLFDDGEIEVGKLSLSAVALAVVRKGWVSPTGVTGIFPSGAAYELYRLNEAGELALEKHLCDRRMNKTPP